MSTRKHGKEKLLIVGGGMATAQLLKELVQNGHAFDITVVSEEAQPCYNRILLSAILSGERNADDLRLLDNTWYEQHRISLYCAESVVEIDLQRRTVVTDAGRQLNFDRLVLATGSRPYMPEIPGIDADGVLGFRSQWDLEKILASAVPDSHAVVIGGGLLGLEAAVGLSSIGMSVSVLNRGNWLMNRQLDEMGGLVLQRHLQRRGIHFYLGTSPRALHQKEGTVNSVELDDGVQLVCDLVLVTAGIVPETTVARKAGITCQRGIEVNGLLQTGIEGVYALGECCEIDGHLFGLVAPVNEQARILARVLTGNKTDVFVSRQAPVQLKVAGVPVVSAGDFTTADNVHSQTVIDHRQGIYRRLLFAEDRLTGFILVGDQQHSAWYTRLMEAGTSLTESGQSLMFGPQSGIKTQDQQDRERRNSL